MFARNGKTTRCLSMTSSTPFWNCLSWVCIRWFSACMSWPQGRASRCCCMRVGEKRTFSLKGGWVLYRKLSMLWVHIFTRCFEPCLHWTCEMNYATVAFLTLAAQQLLESFLDVPPGFVPLHLCSGLVVHF